MKIGEQIKALEKLINQEKQRIVLHGETELSEKYTILVIEKNDLQVLMTQHGDDFTVELSASLVARAHSLDEGISFTRKKTNGLSFLKNLNHTAPSTTDVNTSNRSNSFSS